jgi:DNA-binding IclR family transcriptional regulator
LLADLNADELKAYFDEAGIEASERDAIEGRLRNIRGDGWAMTVDAVEEGLAGIAASIHDGDQIIAALSVSGPSSRWTASSMRSFAPELLSAAGRISNETAGSYATWHAPNLRDP